MKINKKQLLIIILIFIFGFAIRSHLMMYYHQFGFDSAYHIRAISYVIEDFSIPEHDPLAYPRIGGAAPPYDIQFFGGFVLSFIRL